MRNFLRIAQNENVLPIMGELFARSELWGRDRFRQGFDGSAVIETDDILIRYPNPGSTEDYIASGAVDWRVDGRLLPSVRGVTLRLMTAVGAYALGRLLISRLAPGRRILPHTDAGHKYTEAHDLRRYHVILQGARGSCFTCGDETVQMLTGEVWTFDARQIHECVNSSAEDRIHLIADCYVWGRE